MARDVVLLSGGLDSAVILAQAIRQGLKPETVFVDMKEPFTQQEMQRAFGISEYYKINLQVLRLDLLEKFPMEKNGFLPEAAPDLQFVPLRYYLMIGMVANHFYEKDLNIYIGTCASDCATPDSNVYTMRIIEKAIYTSMVWANFHIVLPLQHKTKNEVAKMAKELHVPTGMTYSCVKGGETECGVCFSCKAKWEALCNEI